MNELGAVTPAKVEREWAKEEVAAALQNLFDQKKQLLNFDERAALRLQINRCLKLLKQTELIKY